MGVGKEFWKQGYDHGSITRQLEFIASNYNEFIKTIRIIDSQTQKTYDKKVNAVNELQKLREAKEEYKTKKTKLSNQQKMELEARETELEKIQEEDDLVYFDGVPLMYNEVVALIEKYKLFMKPLNKLDNAIRTPVANFVNSGLTILFTPISKVCDWCNLPTLKEFTEDITESITNSIKNP